MMLQYVVYVCFLVVFFVQGKGSVDRLLRDATVLIARFLEPRKRMRAELVSAWTPGRKPKDPPKCYRIQVFCGCLRS